MALPTNKPTNADYFGTNDVDNVIGTYADDVISGGIQLINTNADGIDTLEGGLGDDIYIVNGIDSLTVSLNVNGNYQSVSIDTSDSVVESVNSGIDTIYTSVNYSIAPYASYLYIPSGSPLTEKEIATLDAALLASNITNPTAAAEVENLVAVPVPVVGLELTGNVKDNILSGFDNAHVDTLMGLDGNDTYVTDATDIVVEGKWTSAFTSGKAGNWLTKITFADTSGTDTVVSSGNVDLSKSIAYATNKNTASTQPAAATARALTDATVYTVTVIDAITGNFGQVSKTGAELDGYSTMVRGAAYIENVTLTGLANVKITGNDKNNHFVGNAGANSILGGNGNDFLDGGLEAVDAAKNDTLVGGKGDDTYIVRNIHDVVITEKTNEGTDVVKTTVNYFLPNNVENLILMKSNISGEGNSANNILTSTGRNNTLQGGAGNDNYYVNVSDNVTELKDAGTDNIYSKAASYTLPDNVENLTLLSSSAVSGTGNSLNNIITGNTNANSLNGDNGNDRLYGGSSSLYFGNEFYIPDGDDTLDGGQGIDTLSGGAGRDTYIVDDAKDSIIGEASVPSSLRVGTFVRGVAVTVDNMDALLAQAISDEVDTVQSSVSFTLPTNIENLVLTGTNALNGTGNSLANDITGNNAANSLAGSTGNDSLNGAAGNDLLYGGVGRDEIKTGTGADVVQFGKYIVDDTFASKTPLETIDLYSDLTSSDTIDLRVAVNNIGVSVTGNLTENNFINDMDALLKASGKGFAMTSSGIDAAIVNAAAGGSDATLKTKVFLAVDLDKNDRFTDNDFVTEVTGSPISAALTTQLFMVSNLESSLTITLPDNVENVTLTGTSSISATGNALDNQLTGNSGRNSLSGGAGNDTLDGGASSDKLTGGLGRDVITDSSGDNTLAFDKGIADTFVSVSANPRTTMDLCNHLNFNGSSGDRIDLTDRVSKIASTGLVNSNTVSGAAVDTASFINNMNHALNVSGTGFDTSSTGITAAVVMFKASHDAFLAVDLNADNLFTTDDFVIEITGSTVSSLTTLTFL